MFWTILWVSSVFTYNISTKDTDHNAVTTSPHTLPVEDSHLITHFLFHLSIHLLFCSVQFRVTWSWITVQLTEGEGSNTLNMHQGQMEDKQQETNDNRHRVTFTTILELPNNLSPEKKQTPMMMIKWQALKSVIRYDWCSTGIIFIFFTLALAHKYYNC